MQVVMTCRMTLRHGASEMDKTNVVCTQLRFPVFMDIAPGTSRVQALMCCFVHDTVMRTVTPDKWQFSHTRQAHLADVEEVSFVATHLC